MIVLLEGLDRTGKTTLARALGEALDAPVIHKGKPFAPDALTEYLSPFTGYRAGRSDTNLVLDRWHWGEMVWPRIFGRRPLMGEREFGYIERALANLGAVAVHCTGDRDAIWNRITREDGEPLAEMPDGYERTGVAHGLFRTLARNTVLPVYTYDFAEHDEMYVAVASVIAMGRGQERRVRTEVA